MNNVSSIPGDFRRMAARCGAAAAIQWLDGEMSFLALDQASDRIAAALCGQGVTAADRIGLLCVNCAEFAVAYLGILKAGATVVPVNLLLSPSELDYIFTDAGLSGLFYHAALGDKARAAMAGVTTLRFAVCIGADESAHGALSLSAMLQNDTTPPVLDIDPAEDVAAILYTSGTTGHPKGAQLTHANLLSNTASVREALGLRPGVDRLLVVLPMFHSFAATVGMLTPLLHGLSFVPVPRFDPGLVMTSIAATAATVFLGVPSMYGLFLKASAEQRAQWRSIRLCVSGGAALPVAVLQGFEARFQVPVVEGDGPTECSPVTCVNPVAGEHKPGSVGLPVPGVEMCIMDQRGCALADGETGEVCVRGPNVMKGYLNQPQANAESFFGAWFRTGDLGYRDADGYFFLVDRKKDMVIVNGMNVYPRMVEEALYRYPGIAEAAVVGEPHARHGEIVVAYVVAAADAVLDSGEIRAYCRQHLGQHEVPRKIVLRDALPKNAAGKILKRELRKHGELERGIDSR